MKFSFETVLEKARYLVFIPVVSLLLSTVFIFIFTLTNFSFVGQIGELSERGTTYPFRGLISAFDLFLLGIISLIFAVSLYELYIKEPGKESKLPNSLKILNLDSLKDKIGKIIYLVLVITFFKAAIYFDYKTVTELLLLSVAIFFIALSIYFTTKKEKAM